MRYQKSQSYQKYFTESSKKYMTALEEFFSDRKVVKAIKKEFPYKKATPIDALRVACCQMMIEVAKADGNFSIEEEIIIEEITRYNVDPEKVKDFAGGYLLNGNGVPLIMGYACFIEEHLRQTKNEEIYQNENKSLQKWRIFYLQGRIHYGVSSSLRAPWI